MFGKIGEPSPTDCSPSDTKDTKNQKKKRTLKGGKNIGGERGEPDIYYYGKTEDFSNGEI